MAENRCGKNCLFGSNVEAIDFCLTIFEGLIGNLVIHEGKGAQSKRFKREFGLKNFWIPVSISLLPPSGNAAGNLYELSLDRKGKLRPIFFWSFFYIVNLVCCLLGRR